jgi:hypothetical protein
LVSWAALVVAMGMEGVVMRLSLADASVHQRYR